MYVVANHLCRETEIPRQNDGQQLDFFTDYAAEEERRAAEEAALERERRMQQALLSIKRRYGKNAILKGMNFEEGATARERNRQKKDVRVRTCGAVRTVCGFERL